MIPPEHQPNDAPSCHEPVRYEIADADPQAKVGLLPRHSPLIGAPPLPMRPSQYTSAHATPEAAVSAAFQANFLDDPTAGSNASRHASATAQLVPDLTSDAPSAPDGWYRLSPPRPMLARDYPRVRVPAIEMRHEVLRNDFIDGSPTPDIVKLTASGSAPQPPSVTARAPLRIETIAEAHLKAVSPAVLPTPLPSIAASVPTIDFGAPPRLAHAATDTRLADTTLRDAAPIPRSPIPADTFVRSRVAATIPSTLAPIADVPSNAGFVPVAAAIAPVRVAPDRALEADARITSVPEQRPIRSSRKRSRSWGEIAARGVRWALGVIAAAGATVIVLMVLYRFFDPPFSSLMVQQQLSGQEITQAWVPLDSISDDVVRAVLLSEDGRFCDHHGVDFEEMQNAIERAGEGGIPRGASTISMQVIKNLFLWPSKSYLRKAIEIPLTYLMELMWPKQRIMEIYLNIAEWGPGIFGVEAASQFHFSKPAFSLNEREAARLAVALPNPITRDAGDPGPRTRRLASDIQARMRAAPMSQTACVATPRRPSAKLDVTRPLQRLPERDPPWQPTVQRDEPPVR